MDELLGPGVASVTRLPESPYHVHVLSSTGTVLGSTFNHGEPIMGYNFCDLIQPKDLPSLASTLKSGGFLTYCGLNGRSYLSLALPQPNDTLILMELVSPSPEDIPCQKQILLKGAERIIPTITENRKEKTA